MAEEARGALLVTTEKDWVRLTPAWRARIATLAVRVVWQDETRLLDLLTSVFPA
jgi:tetraacyldisaccharide 4'-kinase